MEDIIDIEKNRDTKQLQLLAEELYKKYFHHTLHCTLKFNGRFRVTEGQFYIDYHNKAVIEIDPKEFKRFGKDEALKTVKHELIHYHLYMTKGPKKCGHTEAFKKIAKRIHAGGVYVPWSHKNAYCRAYDKKMADIQRYKKDYLYYSYKIGLFWEYRFENTGDKIPDKFGKMRKMYYLGFCHNKDLDKVFNYLYSYTKKLQQKKVGTADIANLTTNKLTNLETKSVEYA